MTTDSSLAEICTVKREDIPETVTEEYSDAERDELKSRIKQLLKEQNAVMVAHYYTYPDLQLIADATVGYVSDSLDMARFGNESEADTLVVCGVKFMGETAKILNPEKRILMPDLNGSSLRAAHWISSITCTQKVKSLSGHQTNI